VRLRCACGTPEGSGGPAAGKSHSNSAGAQACAVPKPCAWPDLLLYARLMQPWPCRLAGRLDKLTITSGLLRANPLSDPYDRPLWVYLPPGYDDEADRFPCVYMLHGYGGSVASWENRPVYGRPFPELADQVFVSGRAEPAVVVFVDGWTRYGGSQFIDSAGTGRYLSYLCDEIVPYVDGVYRTMAARDHRAVIGKSSGGFGALVAAMLRPDVFGGCASHAGDALYESLTCPGCRGSSGRSAAMTATSWCGGGTSRSGCPTFRPTNACLNWRWRCQLASHPARTGCRSCPSTPRPARSARISGGNGSPGTRYG
jgi:pimeloyl-ACP methyl ester carboxylesterase